MFKLGAKRGFPALLADSSREPYRNSIEELLSALFEKRNQHTHVASQDGVEREACEKFLEAVDSLFLFGLRQNS